MAKNSVKEMFSFASKPADTSPYDRPLPPGERRSRPSNSMGKDAEIALLTARVSELERSSIIDVRIDTLVIDDSRRRFRPPEKYRQLVELIKTQGQTDPVKILRMPDQSLVLFEGHNRVHALLELGFKTVKGIILDGFTVLEAEKLAVTSNAVQSESGVYYTFTSVKRLLSLGIDIEDACDLVGIKHKTYSQLVHLDDFPPSSLDYLKESALKLGTNKILELSKLIKNGALSEQALNRVLKELATDSEDTFDVIVSDSQELFPVGNQANSDNSSDYPMIAHAVRSQAVDILVGGKKIGKISVKKNGSTAITISSKAPSDLVEKLKEVIQAYS